MGISIERSKNFSPWIDPKCKVRSYILTKRVAPLQQSFYFVNPSMTRDARYLWFYCAFPPGGDANFGRTLAVIEHLMSGGVRMAGIFTTLTAKKAQ